MIICMLVIFTVAILAQVGVISAQLPHPKMKQTEQSSKKWLIFLNSVEKRAKRKLAELKLNLVELLNHDVSEARRRAPVEIVPADSLTVPTNNPTLYLRPWDPKSDKCRDLSAGIGPDKAISFIQESHHDFQGFHEGTNIEDRGYGWVQHSRCEKTHVCRDALCQHIGRNAAQAKSTGLVVVLRRFADHSGDKPHTNCFAKLAKGLTGARKLGSPPTQVVVILESLHHNEWSTHSVAQLEYIGELVVQLRMVNIPIGIALIPGHIMWFDIVQTKRTATPAPVHKTQRHATVQEPECDYNIFD
jgi:hypothetical protein